MNILFLSWLGFRLFDFQTNSKGKEVRTKCLRRIRQGHPKAQVERETAQVEARAELQVKVPVARLGERKVSVSYGGYYYGIKRLHKFERGD